MSIARKSMIGLAAVLMTFTYVAPSFAELVITGVQGESHDDKFKDKVVVSAPSPAPICISVLGVSVCVKG